jgi:signal transduction histidine kinase
VSSAAPVNFASAVRQIFPGLGSAARVMTRAPTRATVRPMKEWIARLRGVLERHPFAVDAAIAVVLAGLVLADLFTSGDYYTASKAIYVPAALLMTLPLAWRRRYPLPVCVVVMGALAALALAVGSAPTPDMALPAWLLAVFSVAAHCDRRDAVIGGAFSIGAGLVWMGVDDFLFPVVVFGGAWCAGRLVRQRHVYAVTLEERNVALERARETDARIAAAEERARIARELHDVVSHTLGVIVVQAGAERLHLPPDSSSRDAFASIERSGREALEEMGRLLGMLRVDGERPALVPQPSLDRLDELLDRVRSTGLDVELVVEGDPRELGGGLDVSAYRIVQEALTNTVRHSKSRHCRVRLRWEAAALEIEVADDGVGPSADASPPGHGLTGIRERVALYGGALVTGRSDLGGYLVVARLPVPAA